MSVHRLRSRFVRLAVPLVIGCSIITYAQADPVLPSTDPLDSLPASTSVPTRNAEGKIGSGMGSGSLLSRILGSGSATLSAMGTTAILPVALDIVSLEPVVEEATGLDPVVDEVPVAPVETLSLSVSVDEARAFDWLPVVVAPTASPAISIPEASPAATGAAALAAFAPTTLAPEAAVLAIPEPMSIALIAVGLGIGGALRARRRSTPDR